MSELEKDQEKPVEKENRYVLLTSHIYKKDLIIKKWWEDQEFKVWLKLARGEN